MHGAPEADRFRSRWLTSLGAISYALYLVHQPISGFLHGLILGTRPDIGSPAQIGVTCLAVVASLAAAALSRKVLERPVLAWARRITSNGAASAGTPRLVNP